MTPFPLHDQTAGLDLSPGERAIARSVLYAALFDYPLTLSQLRHTLIDSRQTPSEILGTLRRSTTLATVVEHKDGYFFPAGRSELIATRSHREARSRAFLAEHGPLLRIVTALPYVRMVALSGSIAHLNLEHGGDLDLFIVTRGGRVWSTAVIVIVLAKLLGRRRTLCANYVVADSALAFDQRDLFTANQVINLRPLSGGEVLGEIAKANPFVREHYPNFHQTACGNLTMRQPRVVRAAQKIAETLLKGPSMLLEWTCRQAYRRYLRRRSGSWSSPDQVTLGDRCLKLHTRSHRSRVLKAFESAVHDTLD